MIYRVNRVTDAQEELRQVTVYFAYLQVAAQQVQDSDGHWQDKERSSLPHRQRRTRHHADRNKLRLHPHRRQLTAPNLPAPFPLLRLRNLVPPCHQGKYRTRGLNFRDNPKLVLIPPATPALSDQDHVV